MSLRTEILDRLRKKNSAGQSIATGVASRGSEGTLRISESDDLMFVYHTSKSATPDQISGLLPLADANGAVMEIARAGLPKDRPLIAGVCGTDPFRLLEKFLEEIKKAGFAGVQNFPTLGMMDGNFRRHLEESQIAYGKEVEMIRQAVQLDLLTIALVFNLEEAEQMLAAGADVLMLHPGAKAFRKEPQLDDFVKFADKIGDRLRTVRKQTLLLRYDGPNAWVGL